jgi:hypothetical protein
MATRKQLAALAKGRAKLARLRRTSKYSRDLHPVHEADIRKAIRTHEGTTALGQAIKRLAKKHAHRY